MEISYIQYKKDFLIPKLKKIIKESFPDKESGNIFMISRAFGVVKIGEIIWSDIENNYVAIISNLPKDSIAIGRFCRSIGESNGNLRIGIYNSSIILYFKDEDIKFILLSKGDNNILKNEFNLSNNDECGKYIKVGRNLWAINNYDKLYHPVSSSLNESILKLLKKSKN